LWSQQPDPFWHREVAAALQSICPESNSTFAGRRIKCDADLQPEQFAALLHKEPGFLWLDGQDTRHFFLRDPIAVISSTGAMVTVRGPHGIRNFPGNSLDVLQAALDAWAGCSEALLAGFISYDAATELENISLGDATGFPTLHFGLYDFAITAGPECWFLQGTDRWRGHVSIETETERLHQAAMIAPAQQNMETRLSPGPLVSHPDSASFQTSVSRIVDRIHSGDFFQTNLCRRLEAPLDPRLAWPLYRRMRTINPARYGAFLHMGEGRAVLSMSPELFLRVRGTAVETQPIKGTRRRGQTEEEDRELQGDLLRSVKDRAELAMIVDVARNDLSRVCGPGSVRVEEHSALLTLPTLHHTFSRITGRLREAAGLTGLLRASLPAASITGAPKIAAMQAVASEEGIRRGPCMGAIGWLSLDGDMELSVAIRTAFTDAGRVFYSAGCGLTADSCPRSELEENLTKTAAFAKALGLADV